MISCQWLQFDLKQQNTLCQQFKEDHEDRLGVQIKQSLIHSSQTTNLFVAFTQSCHKSKPFKLKLTLPLSYNFTYLLKNCLIHFIEMPAPHSLKSGHLSIIRQPD